MLQNQTKPIKRNRTKPPQKASSLAKERWGEAVVVAAAVDAPAGRDEGDVLRPPRRDKVPVHLADTPLAQSGLSPFVIAQEALPFAALGQPALETPKTNGSEHVRIGGRRRSEGAGGDRGGGV